VQIFENRGAMMGCSNPHPHCQIWANHTLAQRAAQGTGRASRVRAHQARLPALRLPGDGVRHRRAHRLPQRLLVALVPFGRLAVRDPAPPGAAFDRARRIDGHRARRPGRHLKRLTTRYDKPVPGVFPYSLGFHQRPTDGQAHPEWHFHAHFYPPAAAFATVRKFLVGYEMLAMPQRDITPEAAAARLREVGEIHAV